MSDPSTESRLVEALHARAGQVTAERLTPASPPATVTALRRPRPVQYAAAAAAAVAAVAVGVAVVTGSDDGNPSPSAPPSATAPADATDGATPQPPPSDESSGEKQVPGLLPEEDPEWAMGYPDEAPVSYPDGARAVFSRDELSVTYRGQTDRVALDGRRVMLSMHQVQLGQAGLGYLVSRGRGRLALYVPTGQGELVEADVTGDVPFGSSAPPSTRYYTWTTNDHSTLLTRVVVGDPDDWRFRVYRWEVPGPGEGGGPDNTAVELVPTSLGELCFDFDAEPTTVTRC